MATARRPKAWLRGNWSPASSIASCSWARAVQHLPELEQDLVRLLAAWMSAATEFGVLPADLPHVTVARTAVESLQRRDEQQCQPDEDNLYY